MSTALVPSQTAIVQQAENDDHLVAMWLHRTDSEKTRAAYARDIAHFRTLVPKPLAAVTLADLQAYADHLAAPRATTGKPFSVATRQRMLASLKSLFAFALKLGMVRFDPARVVKLPRKENRLAERILTEQEVLEIIAYETNPRNKLLLRLLYASAGRVSEICGLRRRHIQPNGDAGQVSLYGKGGKTRSVVLQPTTYRDLLAMCGNADPDDPVFVSREGNPLSTVQAWRIVQAAAVRAGIAGKVSPHWFRHSHATHAIERGASLVLVKETLGHASLATTGMYTHARPNESSALRLAIG